MKIFFIRIKIDRKLSTYEKEEKKLEEKCNSFTDTQYFKIINVTKGRSHLFTLFFRLIPLGIVAIITTWASVMLSIKIR